MSAPIKRRREKKAITDWRYSDDRFRLGTSPKESDSERAEKDRLIAEFMAKRAIK